jgi:hypothetical protein
MVRAHYSKRCITAVSPAAALLHLPALRVTGAPGSCRKHVVKAQASLAGGGTTCTCMHDAAVPAAVVLQVYLHKYACL